MKASVSFGRYQDNCDIICLIRLSCVVSLGELFFCFFKREIFVRRRAISFRIFSSSECCTETKGQAQGLRLLHQVHVKAVEHLRNTHILPTH